MMGKRYKTIRQLDLMDCGPACLAMVAEHFGKSYPLQYLRKNAYITKQGVSLSGLIAASKKIGFNVFATKLSLSKLKSAQSFLPCIIHWNQNHFVVLRNIENPKNGDTMFYISDPRHGSIKIKEGDFVDAWANEEKKGVAAILTPTEEFEMMEPPKKTKIKLSYLLEYIKPYKSKFISLIALVGLGSLLTLAFPFLTQALIDRGIANKDLNIIMLILLAQLALFLGSMTMSIYRNWLALYISSNASINLISDFLKKLLRLSVSHFDSQMIGDFNQRVQDNERIERLITSETVNTFFSILTFVIFFGVLYYYNIAIVMVYVLLTMIAVLWSVFWLKKRKDLDFHRFRIKALHQEAIYEMFVGIREMKLNQFEEFKRMEWEKVQQKLLKLKMKTLKIEQIQLSGYQFMNHLKNIIVTFMAAMAVVGGQMTLGVLLSISYIIGEMNSPVNQLINFLKKLQDARLSFERIGEIHMAPPEEKEEFVALEEIEENGCDISIQDLAFQYGGPDSQYVLSDISFTLPKGKVTAIVGPSGSGKTTLMKILLRFYDPVDGQIHFGDAPITNISPRSIRLNTGAVLQDGFIFSDTIARNIATCANKDIDQERLIQAMKTACIDEYVNSLPNKQETIIGATGNGLSGGQIQRILIARAVYKNPNFLFLDEATSALDAENERKIHENMQSFFHNRSVLIIAHRLSTVKNADQIIVLDKGKIIEIGNHEELIESRGFYYRLVKNQLQLNQK